MMFTTVKNIRPEKWVIILSLLLILLVGMSAPARAAAPVTFSLSSDPAASTVTVSMTADPSTMVYAASWELKYDSDLVEVIDCVSAADGVACNTIHVDTNGDLAVRANFAQVDGLTGQQDLIVLSYASDTPPDIQLVMDQVVDLNNIPLAVELIDLTDTTNSNRLWVWSIGLFLFTIAVFAISKRQNRPSLILLVGVLVAAGLASSVIMNERPVSAAPQIVPSYFANVPVGTLGDSSCDAAIDIVDALYIKQMLVGERTAVTDCTSSETVNTYSCDVNIDGACTTADADLILACDRGEQNEFCVSNHLVPDSYIIEFDSGVDAQVAMASVAPALNDSGADVVIAYESILSTIAIDSVSPALLNELQASGVVENIMPNFYIELDSAPANTWGQDRVGQRELPLDSDYSPDHTGEGVHVYVIDTGIRSTHSEFTGRIGTGFSSFINDPSTEDCNGHGTHVAGTVGGTNYGIAPGVTLHPVRVFDCVDGSTAAHVVRGIDWVIANHESPAVANLSLSAVGFINTYLDNAVEAMIDAGVTAVVAAGNDNLPACFKSPARLDKAITVGATTHTDYKANFSNHGTCVDLFAPGEDILSAWNTGNSATNSIGGSSMAAPHVAGAVAIHLAQNPDDTPAQAMSAILDSTTTDQLQGLRSTSPNKLLYVPDTPPAPTPQIELLGQIGGKTETVFVEGNTAYIGMGPSLIILDVSDPANPISIGKTDPFPNTIVDVEVVGDVAYVASQYSGLTLVDVSDSTAPTHLGSYDNNGSVQNIEVVGNVAYIANPSDGLVMVDVSDPTAPTLLGSYDDDAFVAQNVQVVESIAYVTMYAGGIPNGLVMIDVSDPTTPIHLGSYDTEGAPYNVEVVGSIAYIADGGDGLIIVDVSDPTTPTLFGSYDTDGHARNVQVIENIAYIADSEHLYGRNKLAAVDVSDPTTPILVGFYNTNGDAYDVQVTGNVAYMADGRNGLAIIDVGDPTTPTLLGSYIGISSAANVQVVDSIAYIVDGTPLVDGAHRLVAMDVSDPIMPIFLGSHSTSGAYGVQVVEDVAYVADGNRLVTMDVSDPAALTRLGSYPMNGYLYDVQVVENVAYVADRTNGLITVDVSDPAVPTPLGSYVFDHYGSAEDVQVVGNIAYIADRINGLVIVDVSDPVTPMLLGFYKTGRETQGVHVVENIAYVVDDQVGLKIIDITDPTSPMLLGSYTFVAFADFEDVQVVNNVAYIADRNNGLVIVDVSDSANPTLIDSYKSAGYPRRVQVINDVIYMTSNEGGLYMFQLIE